MAKLKCRGGYRFVKELGGAVNRRTLSMGATWLVEHKLVRGRVLDFGCGFGFDADHFGWEAYDPYYRQRSPSGNYETIICNHVLNMLTRRSRREAMEQIQRLLTTDGTAWLIVPRNIPTSGKVAMRKRIQNFVQLDLPSVFSNGKLEIYALNATVQFEDRTEEIERRLKA